MSGGRNVTARQGDSVESIADEAGHFWQTVWEAPENAALREARKTAHVILPGDVVFVPNIELRHESKPTTERHRFKRKGVPSKIRVRFLVDGEPRANAAYTFVLDGEERTGSLDGDGWLEQPVHPRARRAEVRFERPAEEPVDDPLEAADDDADHEGPATEPAPADPDAPPPQDVYVFNLRHMDPTSEVSGAQGRLHLLGYAVGTLDGQLNDRTREALRAFQEDQGIEVTGELDDATQAKLAELSHD